MVEMQGIREADFAGCVWRQTHLDLGCARGDFLVALALERPDDFILGIELQSGRAERAQKKLQRLGIVNAEVLQGRLPGVLAERVGEGKADWAHVLFPDPWPKRRHASRRLVRPEFLDELRRVLRPGGRVRFVTDDAEYWVVARRVFLSAGWPALEDEPFDGWPKTVFQERFERQGKPLHGGVFGRPREAHGEGG